jgi:hypothetical protein
MGDAFVSFGYGSQDTNNLGLRGYYASQISDGNTAIIDADSTPTTAGPFRLRHELNYNDDRWLVRLSGVLGESLRDISDVRINYYRGQMGSFFGFPGLNLLDLISITAAIRTKMTEQGNQYGNIDIDTNLSGLTGWTANYPGTQGYDWAEYVFSHTSSQTYTLNCLISYTAYVGLTAAVSGTYTDITNHSASNQYLPAPYHLFNEENNKAWRRGIMNSVNYLQAHTNNARQLGLTSGQKAHFLIDDSIWARYQHKMAARIGSIEVPWSSWTDSGTTVNTDSVTRRLLISPAVSATEDLTIYPKFTIPIG